MASEEFLNQYRTSPAAFTRERKLPFSSVVLFLLSLIRSSLQNELDRFFQVLRSADSPLREVTASAFCQARKKLRPEAFVALQNQANEAFYSSQHAKTWKGFRLVAMDTTTVRIPDAYDNRTYFGEARGPHGGCPSARISCAYDPLNELFLHEALAPYGEGERALAIRHLEVCRPGKDLILLDRGYPAAWFFQLLQTKGLSFCCRTSKDRFAALEVFKEWTANDALVTLPPSSTNKAEYVEHGLAFQPIQVRALRIRRKDQDELILLTSLTDRERYPIYWFQELYEMRWRVEESYKRLVCRIEIPNFSGKSRLTILQDFYAKAFLLNLCSILSQEARHSIEQASSEEKQPRRMNWTHALAKMKDWMVQLFTYPQWRDILVSFQDLLSQTYHFYRPNRRYERRKRFHRRMHHIPYKPIS